MRHLSFEELLKLAEASVSQEGFDDIQIEQLDHLKTCRDCYESFCLLSALSDIMSESGSYMFEQAKISPVKENIKALKAKVLARFQVIRNSVSNTLDVVMEQIDQESSSLRFGPSLAFATRGGGKKESAVIRLEEFEDDKTYIVFKPETNELDLQINIRGMETECLHAYICFEDGEKKEISVTKRGSIIKGTMSNIPNCNFNIVIEAE